MWDSRTQRVVGGGSDRVQRWQHSALSHRDEVRPHTNTVEADYGCTNVLRVATLTVVVCLVAPLPTTVPEQVWLYGGTDSRSHRPCTALHALHLCELPSGWVTLTLTLTRTRTLTLTLGQVTPNPNPNPSPSLGQVT